MPNTLNADKGSEDGSKRLPFGSCLIVIAIVEAAALVFGLIANWLEFAVLVLTTTALTIGLMFTIREMQRLAKESRRNRGLNQFHEKHL